MKKIPKKIVTIALIVLTCLSLTFSGVVVYKNVKLHDKVEEIQTSLDGVMQDNQILQMNNEDLIQANEVLAKEKTDLENQVKEKDNKIAELNKEITALKKK